MLGQKEGLGQVMAQKPQKQIFSGLTTISWKKKSNDWQTNTSIEGYMKMPGESAWSQHSDSAASMFPVVPGWEEDYQDLSPYCQESLQNMLSAKEDATKSFSCIVQDDELNTPEICIQKFDYPAHGNVLSRDDTSPMSLFEDGMWDISSPNIYRQTSIDEKIQDIITSNEVVEDSESNEKYLQTAKEVGSDQFKSNMGVFDNEICIPIVAHEEIVSTEEIVEESVTHDLETESVLIYDKGTECVQFIQSINNVNEVTVIDSDIEANFIKIGSQFDNSTNLSSQDTNSTSEVFHDVSYAANDITNHVEMEVDNSVSSGLDFSFKNQEIDSLTFSKIFHEEPSTNKQAVNINTLNENRKLVTKQKNAESPTRSDAVPVPVQNVQKQLRQNSDLTLNLAAVLGTEDLISTPVILESLLAEEVSFNELLNFVQPGMLDVRAEPAMQDLTAEPIMQDLTAEPAMQDLTAEPAMQDLTAEPTMQVLMAEPAIEAEPAMRNVKTTKPAQTASTVDFSEVSIGSCNGSNNKVENDFIGELVQPVVIKKSQDGILSVSCVPVSGKQIKIKDGKRSGKRTLSKKFVKITEKNRHIVDTNTESTSELHEDWETPIIKKNSQKRKTSDKEISSCRPRGRPPKENFASSLKNDTTFPSRQRKTSYRSDIDDIDSPPSKRGRQSSVESENDKYRELRDRNNEASRKSRLNRKSREAEMNQTAEKLKKENQSLRIKAEEMERLVERLRQALIDSVSKGKS